MTLKHALFGATALLLAAGPATASDLMTSAVITHPSQGEKQIVQDASAHLALVDGGMFVSMETSGLTPGNVHTLWLVTINDPAACDTSPCTSKDVLKRTAAVNADVGYAGGVVVGEDGSARFAYHQENGALNGGWFGNGVIDARSAEVHLVINDHGPILEGRVGAMLSTYRDGCMESSIPGPMPATARAQGEEGPNTCRLMQFSIFTPAQPAS